jgi:ABC-type bacteriocin/lantibiotic exporter with double-glycine peptidase domain
MSVKQLPGIPVWNQLNDPLPDGQQDSQNFNDCGEECVAMLIKAYGGPELPAGQIRMLLHGINGTGITTGDDLVRALAMFKDRQGRTIAAHVRSGIDAATFQVEATHAISSGLPVIALGDWVTRGYGHWVVVRGTDETGIAVNDPWGGLNRVISWSDVNALFDGCYVHLDLSIGALPV